MTCATPSSVQCVDRCGMPARVSMPQSCSDEFMPPHLQRHRICGVGLSTKGLPNCMLLKPVDQVQAEAECQPK
jgi:hypothetical protein